MSTPKAESMMGAAVAVLRDISVQEVPRLLTRRRHTATPGDSLAAGLRSVPHSGSERPAPGALAHTPTYESGWQAGHHEGELLGREEGYRAGLQSGREEGYQQGLKEGRADGLHEAHVAARQAVEAPLRQLDQLLSALPGEMRKRLHESEEEMAALCFEVICRIVGDAVASPQTVREVIRRAVQQLGSQLVAVHVHPADLEDLQADTELNTWLARQSTQGGLPVQWVADDSVELGGCVLRSPRGNLDARLETQLAAVRDVIAGRHALSREVAS
ncbi:FliH/SctL family protein [Ralstonia sp. 1138]|uniref:FliH/SctL family protein n=1 Tax=Ralstonia sp. 1138 TaxID=3156423 RepID=UPI0033967BC5